MVKKMKFTSTVGNIILKETNHSILVLNLSITEESIEKEERNLCLEQWYSREKCSLIVLWSREDTSCTEDRVFAYEKSKSGSKHCCQYQKTFTLQSVLSSPRLLSSIFLFSWVAPRWLRLCPQVIELKTSLCLYLFWFWYPMLYDVNPKLAWRHCLIVCSDLAPSTYAPHSCSPSDTRACSYLLLFSAGTYGLLKKRWRRYSENRGRSPWVLKEILWVSWWKSVVLQLRSQKGKKHRGNNLKSLTHPGTKMTSVFPELP